jgi:hypothetical protein
VAQQARGVSSAKSAYGAIETRSIIDATPVDDWHSVALVRMAATVSEGPYMLISDAV